MSTSPRHKWNQTEVTEVATLFKGQIESGTISTEEVKATITGNTILFKIPPGSVRDKVRSLIKENKNRNTAEPPTLMESPEERLRRIGLWKERSARLMNIDFVDDKSVVSNTTVNSGFAFNDEQTDLMYEIFKELIESNALVKRDEILKAIQDHDRGRVSLQGFTALQLCDKIRTERRRLARINSKK